MVSSNTHRGEFPGVAKFTAALMAFGALMFVPVSPRAQPYLGWDFGHGFGIGVGVPPSAYTRCPTYGWGPLYPYGCRYRFAYRPYGYGYPHRMWIPGHWRYGHWLPGHWA